MEGSLHSINKVIHLPDLQFVQFCQESYGLNRGVYNTIDHWFYNKGLKEIVQRRKQILHFLEYIKPSSKAGDLKFGHGGLSSYLSMYWSQIKLKYNLVEPSNPRPINIQHANV